MTPPMSKALKRNSAILTDYSMFPKEYTVTATRRQLLKAKLFGRKFDEPRITAYLYKEKFYAYPLKAQQR